MDEIQKEQQSTKLGEGNIIAQRYRVIEKIGSGGMGDVFKAEHTTLHKVMALKLMHANKRSQNDIARFQREAKAASALNHPNLVAVHDFGATGDGDLFLAMDYVEGKSLSQEIAERGSIPQSEAIDIFIQVCEGMAAAHSKGILHRDLKPSNIAIDRTGKSEKARILDFGIAKLGEADSENSIDKITQTGEILGSPAYMSPEQCTGSSLDNRSDIYSMGCVMFETLTGKVPFSGDNPVHTLYKHLNERAPLLRSANSEVQVSPELERVVLQALEKEPENRYQSMEDLAADLLLIKHGKNPLKEMSRIRNGWKSVAKLCKFLIASFSLLFVAAIPFLYIWQFQELSTPKWQKTLDRADQQAEINNREDALTIYKTCIKEALNAHASNSALAHVYFRTGMTYFLNDQFDSSITALNESLKYNAGQPQAPECAWAQDFLCGAFTENWT